MSGLELNKIAAAVLVSGLIAMVVGVGSRTLYHGGEPAEQRGYQIEGASEDAGGAAGAAEVASGPVDILPYLGNANVSNGESLAKSRCGTCHTFEKGGANKVGPNQWGLVDSHFAHKADFERYSDAIKALHDKKTWTYQELSEFIENPKKHLPGTAMAYGGMKKPGDRADLIAYLNTLSDSPKPLPKVAPKAEAAPAPEAAAPAASEAAPAASEAAPAEGAKKE